MIKPINTVRPSPIAGTWYSADPEELRRTVDGYLENATLPDLPGEVVALVAPHAGYLYSGSVAGYAFKAIRGKAFKSVAVISPMHQYTAHPILTSAHRAYQTPLGEIPVDHQQLSQISDALQNKIGLSLSPIANDQEHSLEIELPFLQRALTGDFNLIPIMLRDQTPAVAKALGEVLGLFLADSDSLLVASSDLSHFLPEATANLLDNRVLSALVDFSPEGLFDLKARGEGQACGLAAIAAVLWAARELGAEEVTLLNYDTSASTTGDRSSVVGYGAAAITRPL